MNEATIIIGDKMKVVVEDDLHYGETGTVVSIIPGYLNKNNVVGLKFKDNTKEMYMSCELQVIT